MAFVLVTASNATDHGPVVSISLFVAVLCLCILVSHLLKENRWVNESITAIIIGVFIGILILFLSKGRSSHIVRVKKKDFFHNFVTIMLFGVVGVLVSFIIISAGSWWLFPKIGFHGLDVREYLALGAIFSATDSVCTLQVLHQDETPLLYSLVFGEGVVNDATSVVLFNAIQKIDVSNPHGLAALKVFGDFLYLFSTSTVLGVAIGLLTAYALKVLYLGRHSADREIAMMVLMPYLSYLLAELSHLSGILTVFFCGIVMSHYASHNLAENSRITTRHIFATLSFIAETIIFLYLGMDALDTEKWKMTKTSLRTSFGIYSIILFLVLLGRAAFVFPLSALSNWMSSSADGVPISFKKQVIIWWAGLMRGAVSIALAFHQFTSSGVTWDPVHATMITSTIVVVLFSTLVFGFLTKPLISILLPHHSRENNSRRAAKSPEEEDITLALLVREDATKSSLSLLLERPAHTIHAYWRKFDDKYMRPIFGGLGTATRVP